MNQRFGNCCKDLGDALSVPPHSLFRVEENGVLYLTIGFGETEEGTAWFDQAALYCPFCGIKLQDREEIRKSSFEDPVRP